MKITDKFKVRSKTNRRNSVDNATPPRFPLKVESGEVVLRERRYTPDRRHPGLQTQELEVSEEEFDQLFEAYQSQG